MCVMYWSRLSEASPKRINDIKQAVKCFQMGGSGEALAVIPWMPRSDSSASNSVAEAPQAEAPLDASVVFSEIMVPGLALLHFVVVGFGEV